MRRVELEHAAPVNGPEDGLRVLSPVDPREGAGVVRADIPGGDTEALVRALRDRWQVLCRWENGAACFELGPDLTFEELDYVQDAVYRLLLR